MSAPSRKDDHKRFSRESAIRLVNFGSFRTMPIFIYYLKINPLFYAGCEQRDGLEEKGKVAELG